MSGGDVWRRREVLDEATEWETEVVIPPGTRFFIDRSTVVRLLTEAGYLPADA